MKVLGVLQVRLSSSRLPGKAIMPVMGRPLISYQIERLLKAKTVQRWIIATSQDPRDTPLEEIAVSHDIGIFRGTLDDVLDRHYQIVHSYEPEHLLRVGGDCPLTDWQVIDDLVDLHLSGDFDFSSNAYPPSWPDGYDAEIFKSGLINQLWQETSLPSEREHISPYVAESHRSRFKVGNLTGGTGSGLRLTVDEPEDFTSISAILERLYGKIPDFTLKDVLALIAAEPELVAGNQHIVRNAGRIPSLNADKLVIAARAAMAKGAALS